MRGATTRRRRGQTVTPGNMLLIAVGFLVLALIVISPSLADARALDGAGTASLENPPITPAAAEANSAVAKPAGSDAGASNASGGGLGVPGLPQINGLRCLKKCVSTSRATRGAIIAIRGENLERVNRIVFKGKNQRIRIKWRTRSRAALRVTVPRRAVRGHIVVVDTAGRKARSPRELMILPASAIPRQVFPVRGPFSYGSSGSRFGAGRGTHNHQGQDLSASCGTRLVSVRRSRVLYNKWDNGGGYYVVLRNLGTNTDFVYMHLLRRSPLKVGRVIGAGTPIGRVGNTGRSYGCHLHFEYWVGAWQMGGKPINPLPYLKSLRK